MTPLRLIAWCFAVMLACGALSVARYTYERFDAQRQRVNCPEQMERLGWKHGRHR